MAGTQDYGATGHIVRDIKFSPTTGGIIGTTTNDNAGAGTVGEIITSGVIGFTNVTTSNQAADLTSISLTAGDWDVSLNGWMQTNGGTWSEAGMWIGTTVGNSFTEFTSDRTSVFLFANTATVVINWSHSVASFRMSLSGTTTVYLKYYALYSAGTPRGSGRISARRVR